MGRISGRRAQRTATWEIISVLVMGHTFYAGTHNIPVIYDIRSRFEIAGNDSADSVGNWPLNTRAKGMGTMN